MGTGAPIKKSPETRSRFTLSDYASALFAQDFKQAIMPKTLTMPPFDTVGVPGRPLVYGLGEDHQHLGTCTTSHRAEHTRQYRTTYTGNGDWESQATYLDWPAARECGPSQLLVPLLLEENGNNGGGKERECRQGKMASHLEEVCICLDISPPCPRVTSSNRVRSSNYVGPVLQPLSHQHQYPIISGTPGSGYHALSAKPQLRLQTPGHHCHPPVISGTHSFDYKNHALAPSPSPPLTPTIKAERHLSYNQHQQPYWKSLQPAGFAAAPHQSRFVDMFCGPPLSLSQVRLVG